MQHKEKKKWKKYKRKLKDVKIRMELSNTHLLGVPRDSIETGGEAIPEQLVAENIL